MRFSLPASLFLARCALSAGPRLLPRRMHGKGTFKWVDGITYSGDFVRDAIEGCGTYTWPDGAVYEGEVHGGRRHGQVGRRGRDG